MTDAPQLGGVFVLRRFLPPRGSFVRGTGYLRMRHVAADVVRRLVLAQAFIDDLAQQIVFGPGQEFHFGDDLGFHPMQAAQNKR
jgi:hypothetical protein